MPLSTRLRPDATRVRRWEFLVLGVMFLAHRIAFSAAKAIRVNAQCAPSASHSRLLRVRLRARPTV